MRGGFKGLGGVGGSGGGVGAGAGVAGGGVWQAARPAATASASRLRQPCRRFIGRL
jgi:hypothetical protein